MIVYVYSVEIQVEMTVESHVVEMRVETTVEIYIVEILVETIVGISRRDISRDDRRTSSVCCVYWSSLLIDV